MKELLDAFKKLIRF